MSEEHDDRGLAGGPWDPAVSRAYGELPREMPAPESDVAILAAAHRAVGGPRGSGGAFAKGRRYALPALAAMLVLSVSLVALMIEKEVEGPTAPEPAPALRAPPLASPGNESAPPAAVLEQRMPQMPNPSRGHAFRPDTGKSASRASEGGPSSPALRRLVEALEGEPSAKWLDQIAMLRREGHNAEADALRIEFERRFPDHPRPTAREE